MAAPQKTLESLGASVAELSKALAQLLQAANHPEPSLSADGPASLPPSPEVQGTRLQLQETLMTLLNIATGPSDFWTTGCFYVSICLKCRQGDELVSAQGASLHRQQ